LHSGSQASVIDSHIKRSPLEISRNETNESLIERKACYRSWVSYLYSSRESKQSLQLTRGEPTIKTSTLIYETIKSFGPNTTYTACDGVPRLRFTNSPTGSSTAFVTLTITRDESSQNRSGITDDDTGEPKCTLIDAKGVKTDEDYIFCDKLSAAADAEIGDATAQFNWTAWPPEKLCPRTRACHLILHEVVIIYWPKKLLSRDICGLDGYGTSLLSPEPTGTIGTEPVVVTTDAITFRGQDIYLRTINGKDLYAAAKEVEEESLDFEIQASLMAGKTTPEYIYPSTMSGTWTFTSPTAYLAHREITANIFYWTTSKKVIFQTTSIRDGGIIPLQPGELSTIHWVQNDKSIKGGLETARSIAKGLFRPTLDDYQSHYAHGRLQTRVLDFGHLPDPVPASIYYDAHDQDCWGEQSHCATITDDSYRPKLFVDRRVWESILPEGFDCGDPMVRSMQEHCCKRLQLIIYRALGC
jgi:hypothetical protein